MYVDTNRYLALSQMTSDEVKRMEYQRLFAESLEVDVREFRNSHRTTDIDFGELVFNLTTELLNSHSKLHYLAHRTLRQRAFPKSANKKEERLESYLREHLFPLQRAKSATDKIHAVETYVWKSSFWFSLILRVTDPHWAFSEVFRIRAMQTGMNEEHRWFSKYYRCWYDLPEGNNSSETFNNHLREWYPKKDDEASAGHSYPELISQLIDQVNISEKSDPLTKLVGEFELVQTPDSDNDVEGEAIFLKIQKDIRENLKSVQTLPDHFTKLRERCVFLSGLLTDDETWQNFLETIQFQYWATQSADVLIPSEKVYQWYETLSATPDKRELRDATLRICNYRYAEDDVEVLDTAESEKNVSNYIENLPKAILKRTKTHYGKDSVHLRLMLRIFTGIEPSFFDDQIARQAWSHCLATTESLNAIKEIIETWNKTTSNYSAAEYHDYVDETAAWSIPEDREGIDREETLDDCVLACRAKKLNDIKYDDDAFYYFGKAAQMVLLDEIDNEVRRPLIVEMHDAHKNKGK